MPQVTAPTHDEALAKLLAAIEDQCAIAFACDCRLAVSPPFTVGHIELTLGGLFRPEQAKAYTLQWSFVVLSPGEQPPAGEGWTIYENHNGMAVGRTA